MSEIAIRVSNLTKIYHLYNKPIDRMKEALSFTRKKYGKEHYALKNVTFHILKGETIGIIGTNGSGKSTLLKIITGILTPSQGNIEVKGKISALLELGAGFNPEYTGMENIYLNGTMMGYSKEEMEVRIPEVLKFADIGDFIYQPVKTYSSGMFARLAFAVAINVEPDILIIDEALSVGDVRFQIKCMDKMKEMMEKQGTTVLLVSHDINAIRRFCKRAIWIDKGEIRLEGEVNRVSDKYMEYLNYSPLVDKSRKILPAFEHSDGSIAKIISVEILNEKMNPVEEIRFNEKIFIEVIYDVYDEKIDSPVIGIAFHKGEKGYICGLNTLLDEVRVDWKYGRNKIVLEYTEGVRSMGGDYFFDVAIMDKTASVAIQYLTKWKKITVFSEYKAEGEYIIPHKWRKE